MRTTRAVVLARGAGTRMREEDPAARLTDEQRRAADAGLKSMLPINGRPFLDYVLDSLARAGLESVALVVAPEHDVIRDRYAHREGARLSIDFVVQPEALGTANAVICAEPWTAGEPFLTMNADNLYPVAALRALAESDEPALPAFERADLVRSGNIPDERVRAFAILETDRDGYLAAIVEKPDPAVVERAGPDARVSMNCWRFDNRIFAACRDVPRSVRGEFELPQAVALAVQRGVRFRAIPALGPVLDLSRRADAAEVSRRLAGIEPHP